MLNIVVFLCIVTVLTSIFIGFILLKGYTLIKDYKKKEEDFTYLHSKIKELEDDIIQPMKNNSILNQKHDIFTPKIKIDNKIYSKQEFFKEINNGKIQISSMLQSKLYGKR